MRPSGRFTVQIDPTVSHHYLGSPAAAYHAGAEHSQVGADGRAESHFTLIYGNRATGSIMFREELHDLRIGSRSFQYRASADA